MKRSRFGFGLLLFLLAAGLFSTRYMDRCHGETAQLLTEAAEQAQGDHWAQAVELSRLAKKHWQKSWRISAAFADHEPMEEIDAQFAQLEIYAGAGERLSFCALCAQLASDLKAMGDAHALNWWNLV